MPPEPPRRSSPFPSASSVDWRTPAERAEYRTTPDYAETIAFLERLVAGHPATLRLEPFGTTGEGRTLWTVIASRDGEFDPARIHAAGRVVLLVQNSIHSGEMDGKDACLALLRDLVERPELGGLPSHVVLVVVPVYNADGHERRSPFHRINQTGPEAMGWRGNGTNLNLNRDYLKADAPETRAFLRLFHRWLPDFFVDNHVTDGADMAYEVTFALDATPDVDPDLGAWIGGVVPELVAGLEASGHPTFPDVVFLKDETDPLRGLAAHDNPPRFSTGYTILENRPGLLVELHMLKEYRIRVRANYDLLRVLLQLLERDAATLISLNRTADDRASRLGRAGVPGPRFPLILERDGTATTVPFLGKEFRRSMSDVSGSVQIEYLDSVREWRLPKDTGVRVAVDVVPPAAYLVPPAWTAVLEVLSAHQVEMRRTTADWSGVVERYRCTGMRWPARPFEGRHPILRAGNVEPAIGEFGRCELRRERASYPAGSSVVDLSQRRAKVAIHWLEPEAPDSALRWGFFDTIFEQKESAEGYLLEPLARGALASDPVLRADFQRRLVDDPGFAADAGARLAFFYDRSPWGLANRVGEYPVARLSSLEGVPLT